MTLRSIELLHFLSKPSISNSASYRRAQIRAGSTFWLRSRRAGSRALFACLPTAGRVQQNTADSSPALQRIDSPPPPPHRQMGEHPYLPDPPRERRDVRDRGYYWRLLRLIRRTRFRLPRAGLDVLTAALPYSQGTLRRSAPVRALPLIARWICSGSIS